MSLTIGRINLEPPDAWPEPIGDQVTRVGGVPTPGARSGTSISSKLTLAPPDTGTRADRQRVRRQLRSLTNNAPARLQGIWVAWSDDDEQDGWYVPTQATIDLTEGALASGFFTASLGLDLVGRPRTHRPAALARVHDLRAAATPKDGLNRLYGPAFDGSPLNGSAVTPAPLVWLPSDTQDVIIAGPGSPSYGPTRQGRGGSSLTSIQGVGDLSVVHFEQDPAHRLRGDVILYDRRGETGTAWDAVNPHPAWEEVYGVDWPWVGRVSVENSLCRVIETDNAVLSCAYWDGAQYAPLADLRPRVDGEYLDTVLSRSVVEWSPERAVMRIVMHRASMPGSRTEVLITLQRGWRGPKVETYTSGDNGTGLGLLPVSAITGSSGLPLHFESAPNYGWLQAGGQGITLAVPSPRFYVVAIPGGVTINGYVGVVAARIEHAASADVAAEAARLGGDVLAATQYPQTIVAR